MSQKEQIIKLQEEIQALRSEVADLSTLIREQSKFDRKHRIVMSMDAMHFVETYWSHPSDKAYRRVKNSLIRYLKTNSITVRELYDNTDRIPGISLVYSRKIRNSIDKLTKEYKLEEEDG